MLIGMVIFSVVGFAAIMGILYLFEYAAYLAE